MEAVLDAALAENTPAEPQTDLEVLNTPDATPSAEATPVSAVNTSETSLASPEATPVANADPNTSQPEPEEEFASTDEPLTVKALQDKINKNPDLLKAVNADPGLKNLLFTTARQAQKLEQFKEIFQTPDAARTTLELANQHLGWTEAFKGGDGAKSKEALFEASCIKDANGNIQYDAAGNPLHDESYTRLIASARGDMWGHATAVALEALKLNPQDQATQDLLDAVGIVSSFFKDKIESPSTWANGGKGGNVANVAAAQPTPQLPDDVKQRLDRLDAIEAQNNTNVKNAESQHYQAITTGISTAINETAKGYLDNVLKANSNIALSSFAREAIVEKAVKELNTLASNDPSYKNHIQHLFRTSPKDDSGKEKLVIASKTYAKERLPKLISKYIKEATETTVSSQKAKDEKIQKQTNRPEVKSNSGVAPQPARSDMRSTIKEFATKNKRMPTDREVLDL